MLMPDCNDTKANCGWVLGSTETTLQQYQHYITAYCFCCSYPDLCVLIFVRSKNYEFEILYALEPLFEVFN